MKDTFTESSRPPRRPSPSLFALIAFLASLADPASTLALPATAFEFPFQDPDLAAEERITDLIGRMTLEEKIDCLAVRAAVPRLGVKGSPHIEGYHGVAQGGPSNWGRRNPTRDDAVPPGLRPRLDLGPRPRAPGRGPGGPGGALPLSRARSTAARASSCARPTPTSRAIPRWGRTEEVYGEDPFHVGTLATAFTRGPAGRRPALLEDGVAPEALPRQQQRGRRAPALRRTSTSACGASTTRSPSRWRSARAARAR